MGYKRRPWEKKKTKSRGNIFLELKHSEAASSFFQGCLEGQAQWEEVVIYLKKMLRRGVASCDKAHIGGSLQEEREGAEKGAGGTERGTETVPWGQEWRKRKRGREGERQRKKRERRESEGEQRTKRALTWLKWQGYIEIRSWGRGSQAHGLEGFRVEVG